MHRRLHRSPSPRRRRRHARDPSSSSNDGSEWDEGERRRERRLLREDDDDASQAEESDGDEDKKEKKEKKEKREKKKKEPKIPKRKPKKRLRPHISTQPHSPGIPLNPLLTVVPSTQSNGGDDDDEGGGGGGDGTGGGDQQPHPPLPDPGDAHRPEPAWYRSAWKSVKRSVKAAAAARRDRSASPERKGRRSDPEPTADVHDIRGVIERVCAIDNEAGGGGGGGWWQPGDPISSEFAPGGGAGGGVAPPLMPPGPEIDDDDDTNYAPVPMPGEDDSDLKAGLSAQELEEELEAEAVVPPFCYLCWVDPPERVDNEETEHEKFIKVVGQIHTMSRGRFTKAIQGHYNKRLRHEVKRKNRTWALSTIRDHFDYHTQSPRMVHENVIRTMYRLSHMLLNNGCILENGITGKIAMDLKAINTWKGFQMCMIKVAAALGPLRASGAI